MKISLNWLKKYVKIGVSDEELVRLIGARLVEVEGVIDETHKYDNIYIVRVESAEHIPDTHLSLCKINVGKQKDLAKVEYDEDGLVQVMCGAPNVRAGMLAAWIAPGAVVPASVHEDAPFVIGKRRMLGKYDSYGMLAGADELDFGDDHSGIVEIDPAQAKPGDALADIFELNDLVLDIENKSLTHRPDCFGLIGFAREVAGILGEKFDGGVPASAFLGSKGLEFLERHTQGRGQNRPAGEPVRSVWNIRPKNSNLGYVQDPKKVDAGTRGPKILISDPAICARYSAIVLEKHGELKRKYLTWQDTILSKSGMRPLDPIVDATNYLMLLTGQPLHAFDYDKFVAVGGGDTAQIGVRLAREGEKLLLLDGKEIALQCTDIVITSQDKPVALAGAMGGASTMVDENTRKIIIEAATFSLYNLRKTQMEHGIFSEAITRFTKGQPPYQTLQVGLECAEMLSSGFKVVEMTDEYPRPEKPSVVRVSAAEINGLLGTDYAEKLIVKTLSNVGFEVAAKKGALEVTAPAWRTDIHIREDVIEEVGRLLGYDNIPPVLPRHATASRNPEWDFKLKVAETLRNLGANEVLTYSFVSEKLLEKAAQDPKNSYKIVNSISPDLQYIRQSIVPSLLDKAYLNQKIPVDKFAIFEINKVYQKKWGMDDEGVPVERMQIGLVLAERKSVGAAYYKAQMYAAKLLAANNIAVKFCRMTERAAWAAPFERERAAEIRTLDGTLLGVVGEFKNSVRRNFKLEPYVAGFELDFAAVLAKRQECKIPSDFIVKNKEDLTITTSETYAETLARVEKKYPGARITPVGIYQPQGATMKNITFHIETL